MNIMDTSDMRPASKESMRKDSVPSKIAANA